MPDATLTEVMRALRACLSCRRVEQTVDSFLARLLSACLNPSQPVEDLEFHRPASASAADASTTFQQLRAGASELKQQIKQTVNAAIAQPQQSSQQSISSILSIGSSVVNRVTSSLHSSISAAQAASNVSAPHPSHRSTLLLLVMGEMSWKEVNALLSVAASHPQCNVVIGCTGLANAEDVARKTLGGARERDEGTVSLIS
jgi:hypothetical protein